MIETALCRQVGRRHSTASPMGTHLDTSHIMPLQLHKFKQYQKHIIWHKEESY
jgi:hypothetical protein